MKKALLDHYCLPQATKNLLLLVFIIIFSLAGLQKASAQTVAGNYNWSLSNTALTYTTVTGGTVLWSGNAIHFNNPTVAVAQAPKPATIGFNFEYNGQTYSSCSVSKNGFLTFGTTTTTSVGNNPPISGITSYDGAVSGYAFSGGGLIYAEYNIAYGAGLYPSEIRYETSGTTPNQVFTVQYKNLIRKSGIGGGSSVGLFNFQIKLYEGSNKIETIYDIFNPTAPAAVAAVSTAQQVGLRGANNTDYSNVRGGWSNITANLAVSGYTSAVLTPVTANSDSQIINSTVYPAVVTKYTWTPCYQVRALIATALSTSVVTWTAPWVGYTGLSYDYEVRTSGNFGSGASGLVQSGNTTVLTFTATGLNAGTVYNIYVRTSCGLSPAATVSIIPTCAVATLPYVQNFESATVPAIPSCNTVQNVGTNPFVTNNHPISYYGFNNKNVEVESTVGSNTWYFTQKMTFPAAGSYKLSYKYGGSRQQTFFQQKMRVFYGPNNTLTAGTMTGGIQIDDHPAIKTSPEFNIVNFVVPAAGDYFIGFQGYAVNQGFLLLDDILLEPSVCLTPNSLIAQDITGTSALLTWNDSATVPDGYVYYYSTSSTPPTNADQTGNGYVFSGTSVIISGLTGSTNYYVWVRSFCDGGADFGAWTPMTQPITGPYFTTLFVPSYCVFTPSVSSASYLSNFNTTGGASNINNTTGYSAGGYGNFIAQTVSQFANGTINFGTTLAGTTVGVAIWVDWNNDGTFDNTIYNSVTNPTGEKMFNTAAYVLTASGSFAVPAGQAVGNYRMRVMADYWAQNPIPCAFSTTNPPSRGEIEDYTFKCIVPPPPLTLSSYTSTQCAGTPTGLVTITTPLSNFQKYEWLPVGPTGTPAGYVFNNLVSQTYILTASQTVAPFSVNTVKYDYIAVQLPTTIVLDPVGPITTCQAGPAALIKATGGIVGGYEIYSEDFNGPTNIFSYGTAPTPPYSPVNNSFNGAPANAAWTLRQSPYTTPTAAQTISSNDNSQYYLSDSDGGGSTGSTREELVSTVLNLQTYLGNTITDANLTYWHYYRGWLNGTGTVQISTDGGATYAPALATYSTATVQGATAGSFVQESINLAAYVGNANVRIKFYYSTNYGYRWAIDNFKITASINSTVNWNLASSPVIPPAIVPGLFTNLAGTTPYISGTAASTVYAMPATNTSFTATSATTVPLVCKTSTNITVNVTPIVAGTVSSAQTICTGTATNLTLTGQSGTIAEWQWSAVSPFTVPSTNIIAGSGGSTTLTSAQMGLIPADRYYRVKITNGSCIAYSIPIKITVAATTWNGGPLFTNGTPDATKSVIFNSSYTSTGNINACSIVVNSPAVVTIDSNHVLTIENTINTATGTLVFNNGASLIQNNNNANTTPIRYLRNSTLMRTYDYTYWSAPVQNQILYNVSPFTMPDKYFYWNTAPATYNWSVINNGAVTMATGRGYIARSSLSVGSAPAIYTAPFIGIPNNGNLTTPIEVSGVGGVNNLNLIGNPYPSALSANLFLTANSGVIGGTIYFWTHNTPLTGLSYNNNDYASYNLSGGVGTAASIQPVTGGVGNNAVPNGFIGTGQAFFAEGLPSVATQPGGIVNANFTNAMRVTSNGQFYRTSATQTNSNNNNLTTYEQNRIWLEIADAQGAYSQMLYGNIEGATNGKDHFYDGNLFTDEPTVSLYSILGNDKLTIKGNALPFADTDTNQVGYISKIDGNFEIKLADFDGLFTDQNIYLEDKSTNEIHDLKANNYNFSTLAGTFNDRFLLRFNNTTLSDSTYKVAKNSLIVYKKISDIYINSGNISMKAVSIIDAAGRIIYNNKSLNNSEVVINNLNVAQQVLIVQVTTQDGTITNKKIIF